MSSRRGEGSSGGAGGGDTDDMNTASYDYALHDGELAGGEYETSLRTASGMLLIMNGYGLGRWDVPVRRGYNQSGIGMGDNLTSLVMGLPRRHVCAVRWWFGRAGHRRLVHSCFYVQFASGLPVWVRVSRASDFLRATLFVVQRATCGRGRTGSGSPRMGCRIRLVSGLKLKTSCCTCGSNV